MLPRSIIQQHLVSDEPSCPMSDYSTSPCKQRVLMPQHMRGIQRPLISDDPLCPKSDPTMSSDPLGGGEMLICRLLYRPEIGNELSQENKWNSHLLLQQLQEPVRDFVHHGRPLIEDLLAMLLHTHSYFNSTLPSKFEIYQRQLSDSSTGQPNTGVSMLENTPPPPPGEISSDVIRGKI
jgi:hypothetical protein